MAQLDIRQDRLGNDSITFHAVARVDQEACLEVISESDSFVAWKTGKLSPGSSSFAWIREGLPKGRYRTYGRIKERCDDLAETLVYTRAPADVILN